MLLPYSWLKQFVPVSESVDEVAERFVSLGLEAESIHGEIIDLDVTPNRGDLLSMYGLAREYAASTAQTAKFPEFTPLQYVDSLPGFKISGDPKTYHRLGAVIIRGVTIGESPAWLKTAVESMGANSINNVVDLTNYIMYETGIPMHAFDLDQLPETSFTIRLSRDGETYTSLKDETRTLPEGVIVVDCGGEIVDLLGIRGGKSSMIQSSTRDILLWAVSIPRPLVRRAAKLLQIHTDGSYRHERETDWSMVPVALSRITDLTLDLASGTKTEAIDHYPSPQEIKQIKLSEVQVNQLLGTALRKDEIDAYLTRLGFSVDGDTYRVPSWRYFDVNLPEDLIEEVARIHGYNSLPRKVIVTSSQSAPTDFCRIEALKDRLVADGWTETYTESFAGKAEAAMGNFDQSKLATLANPVNRDFAFCRPAITPSLVKLLALNSWADDAKVFEIAHVFPEGSREETHVAFAAYGNQTKLLQRYVPADSIDIISPDHPLGKLFKIRRPVSVVEVLVDSLVDKNTSSYSVSQTKPSYTKVSAFPPSVRDISMIINTDIDLSALTQDIQDTAPETIILAEVFDTFQSDTFGPNKQSVAIHVVYQSASETLESGTVDAIQAKILTKLQSDYQAVIR